MPEEKQIPFWPSWNTEHGRDYDPDDFQGPTDLQAVYAAQRQWEKDRLKDKKS